MKVDRVELYKVIIPLSFKKTFFGKQPCFYPNWIPGYPQSEMRLYLLAIGTNEGLQGYAAIPAMATERDSLGPCLGMYLMGINPLDIDLVNQRIQEFSYLGLRNGWIDAAFWDIIGKAREMPLWKLLGGTGGSVRPYWSMGDSHHHDPEKAKYFTQLALKSGYPAIKLRVKSMDLKLMSEYVRAARKEAGQNNFEIMVDANQGWPVSIIEKTPIWSLDFAQQFANLLEESRVYWLEEPLNRGNIEGLAKLRSRTKTKIAGGELNSSLVEFKKMLEVGALDIYQPDAVLAEGTYGGGISAVQWLVNEIKKTKYSYCPHTWTTGLGFVVNLHLFGLIPEAERHFIEFPTEGPWNADTWGSILKERFWPDSSGKIQLPEKPGLGVTLDWGIIRRFGKCIYRGTSRSVSIRGLFDLGLKRALEVKQRKLIKY